MKAYFRIPRLRIFGAPVYLHWSALIVIAICALTAFSDPINAVSAVCSYLGIILLHEAGHGWVVTHYGYRVREYRLSIVHGLCVYECGVPDAWETAVIAWGGVVAQLLVAVPVLVLSSISGIEHVRGVGPIIVFGGYLSLMMVFVNLAPSPYLDGSKAWPLVPMFFARLRTRKRPARKRSSRLKAVK